MRLVEVAEQCRNEPVFMPNPDTDIIGACTLDLLSEGMAHGSANAVLVTVQNHKNAAAVCTQVCLMATVVTHNRALPDDMLESVRKGNIALFRTAMVSSRHPASWANCFSSRQGP